jgi:MipA family protein
MSQSTFEAFPGQGEPTVSPDRGPPATQQARGQKRRGVPALWLTLAMLGSGTRAAFGGESTASQGVENFDDQWNLALGVGALYRPRYPGSRDYFTQVLPVLSVSYGRYFLGAVPGTGNGAEGLGAYLARAENWSVGISFGRDVREPRRASDAPVLEGWGEIPRTDHASVFGNYRYGWLVAHGDVSADIGGHHEGVLASLSLQGVFHPVQYLTLAVGPEITWANTQYTQTFFGIDAAQSAIAGIPPHAVKGGLDSAALAVGADYRLTSHWILGVHAKYGELQGDAADSPVTETKTQYTVTTFVSYRFGQL